MKTTIIIPIWNQADYLKQCLESIDAYTPEENEVLLIDNASTEDMSFLEQELLLHPNWTYVRNEMNNGAARAINQGMQLGTGDYFVWGNSDIVVSKEWLKGLIEAAESANDIGLVGPMSNYVFSPQLERGETGYDSIIKYLVFAETYRKAHRGLYVPYWKIIPFCGLIKRSVTDKVGLMDDSFFPGNFADDDYCMRLMAAGYRNLIVKDVFIHHHGSQSMKQIDFTANLEYSKAKFYEKWPIKKSISAVLIVKNEEENIKRCLDSLNVDEIIVVDTGSTDSTKEIASQNKLVKLYDFEWCDDFSAARNFANSKATKDWIFSIDADEVVTGLDQIELNHHCAYKIATRNYNNNPRWTGNIENDGSYKEEAGMRWFSSIKVRLWPNDKRIKFEYPVHEVVEPTLAHLGLHGIDEQKCIVHHYGRLNDNYEYGRGDKYWRLLQKQYESGINNERSIEQLALQAQGMRKYEEAIKLWSELLNIDAKRKEALFNTGHCYAELLDWDKALEFTRMAYEMDKESREIKINLATCEAMVGNLELAEQIAAEILTEHPGYTMAQGLINAIKIRRKGEINGDIKVC